MAEREMKFFRSYYSIAEADSKLWMSVFTNRLAASGIATRHDRRVRALDNIFSLWGAAVAFR
jgi:hypothetical protein